LFDFFQPEIDVFPLPCVDIEDFKWIFFFWNKRHFCFDGIPGDATQINMRRIHSDKFLHHAGYNQILPWTAYIIGVNTGGFSYFSTTVSSGIDS
jgi:hypothetical protein